MFEIKKIWCLILIVGQFGTGQFGTKIIKGTIWHQDNKSGQFGTKIIKVDNLALGQFGTRTIWHRTIWHQDKKSKKNAFFCNFSQNQVPYFSGNVALFEVPNLFWPFPPPC